MLNHAAIFLISKFLLANNNLESNFLSAIVHKKLVLVSFSLSLLGFFLILKFLLFNNIKGQKTMINLQNISNKISSDTVFTQLIDVANNIDLEALPECFIKVLEEAKNETTIKYALKTIECLSKEAVNNIDYNPEPRNPQKVISRVSNIKKTSQKAKQVNTMLQYEAKNKISDSTTVIPYGGGKQTIDEKIKAAFMQMPADTKTIFEGFGGGFNIPYIYSDLDDINPDIEYIITETNKTVVNLMRRIKSEQGFKSLKKELAKLLAEFNANTSEALKNMPVGSDMKQTHKAFFYAKVAELNKLEEAKRYNTRCAALFYYTMNGSISYGYKMVDGISKLHFGKDGISSQNIFAKLELFHKAFNKINLKILNISYLEASKKLDKKTTFAVFDPPYISDDESVKLGRKTQIYGLKSFDHQKCADEFKKYNSGMYFNNLNTPFKNANLDMGAIEEWSREGKQTNGNNSRRAVSEIFVIRDVNRSKEEAVLQNLQKTAKQARKSDKSDKKYQKTSKSNQFLAKNKKLNIKSLRKFKLANAVNNTKYVNNKYQKNVA